MRTILISAYACEPLKGSEQGVGWNWVLQMAKTNRLHVLTRANNKEVIEANIPKVVEKNITFHYYDTHKAIKGLKNKAKGLYFYYFCWQLGLIPLIYRLSKQYDFAYSMHLTFGSIWMPTVLPFFKFPFIWGPIGGGEGEPFSFLKTLPMKQRGLQYVRLLMNSAAILNPTVFIASLRAKSILVRTENTAKVIPKIFRSKVKTILETAMEDDIFNFSKEVKNLDTKKVRLLTTGRLMPSKNIITVIRAIGHLPKSYPVTLTVVGSGSESKYIDKEITLLGLDDKIIRINETSRANVLNELTDSDIYLFPSLREGGSWALMEAMAIGLPVICLNWSGMEIITDDESAIRLPVTNPEQMPKDMAEAICKLIDNPELRRKMGETGRYRIKNVFNWEAKGVFINQLFNELDKEKLKSL